MKKRRAGGSLFEVLVVMAIIVIISALSFPSLNAMYGSYRLNSAVDAVRAAWAEARAHAIEESRPYRFAVSQNGSGYRVAPDEDEYWQGSDTVPDSDPNGQGIILSRTLPGGVKFSVDGGTPPSEAEEVPMDTPSDKEAPASDWTPVAVFLPDGTAREDVKIMFQLRGVRPTSLQLRGLTGNVSMITE